ncbi:hypothetical protein ES705_36657 [subsurface metagenome]
MILQWDTVKGSFLWFAQSAAWMLIFMGVIWAIYAIYEINRRGSFSKRKVESWDFDITKVLRSLTYIGILMGIIVVISAIVGIILNEPPSFAYIDNTADEVHLFTSVFLIIIGILAFLKPLNDMPIAGVLGIAAASFISILVAFYIPDSAIEFIGGYLNPKILLIIVFAIIFAVVAITIKFYTAGLMFIAKVLSWPPIALILAVFCFIQGFALLAAGVSII